MILYSTVQYNKDTARQHAMKGHVCMLALLALDVARFVINTVHKVTTMRYGETRPVAGGPTIDPPPKAPIIPVVLLLPLEGKASTPYFAMGGSCLELHNAVLYCHPAVVLKVHAGFCYSWLLWSGLPSRTCTHELVMSVLTASKCSILQYYNPLH